MSVNLSVCLSGCLSVCLSVSVCVCACLCLCVCVSHKPASFRLFPCLPRFLEQFRWARDRYKLYALQGPSQAAKTSFVKSLFKSPFVLTIQGQDVLNLQSFQYGRHDALVLDNLVEWSLILKYRALLQSNVDLHVLGESATGIYSYSVFLWGVPICITLDADVDSTPFMASEWLQANVYRDVLPVGAKCYFEGARPHIPMSQVPKLKLSA